MRRVWNQELLARIATGLKQSTYQQDAGEFPVRPSSRLQRDGIHAGDLRQNLLERPHYFENSLRERFGLIGMRPRQSFNTRHLLIHARIVFHCA